MTTELPPRYKNKDGKEESVNSYETFYNIYIKSDKKLTAKQLAKKSGFTESTCQNWIKENKYIERKAKIKEEEAKKQQQKQQSLMDIIGSTLEDQIKLNTLTDNGFMMKTRTAMQEYSEDNQLRLEHLDINSKTYKKLQEAQRIDKRRPLITIETIQAYHTLQRDTIEHEEEQTILEEAMEAKEEIREINNLEKLVQLRREMQDDEY